MALATDSSLETVSFVLTKDQVRRLRALRDLQASDHRRVSLSDIARDVVDKGLQAFSLAPNIDFTAMQTDDRNIA